MEYRGVKREYIDEMGVSELTSVPQTCLLTSTLAAKPFRISRTDFVTL